MPRMLMRRMLMKRMLLAIALCSAMASVSARTGDRTQPMDAEANQNSCTLGDAGQCVMTGNVAINQGSLDIHAAKATIFRSGGDISRAVLSGSPVLLKQQMDDGTLMNARASNVDYNLSNDIVVFTGDVVIQQPRGTMSGQRVVYNLKTGAIDSGGEGNGRVKMRILPHNGQPAPASDTATKSQS
jgi:lipopolysaccharide export system protein LptA